MGFDTQVNCLHLITAIIVDVMLLFLLLLSAAVALQLGTLMDRLNNKQFPYKKKHSKH